MDPAALGVGSLQSVVRVCAEMVGCGLLRVHWLAYRFLAVGPAFAFLLVVGSGESQGQRLSYSRGVWSVAVKVLGTVLPTQRGPILQGACLQEALPDYLPPAPPLVV